MTLAECRNLKAQSMLYKIVMMCYSSKTVPCSTEVSTFLRSDSTNSITMKMLVKFENLVKDYAVSQEMLFIFSFLSFSEMVVSSP